MKIETSWILTKKRIVVMAAVIVAIMAIVPAVCYEIIALKTKDRIYDDLEKLPEREVGIVLGTGPTTMTGESNSYFLYRIDAAEELYKAGKIKYILISGDNSRKDYSEPDVMKDSLVARGIPEEVIYLDYAGFRTLDSVVRSKKVFEQTTMIVISQQFHNERSLALGDWQGMELIGYNAKETSSRFHTIRAHIREGFARVKLLLDMLTNKQPKFLGKPIEIGEGCIQSDINHISETQKNIVIEETNGLKIYYPQYTNIDLVCGEMPNPKENRVLFCCEAAFTGELLKEFKHSNIAGHHVSSGEYFKGYSSRANTGCFAFYNDTKTWDFCMNDYAKVLKSAVKRNGMAFGQSMIIYKGAVQKTIIPRNPSSKNEYRALCELNGKLCVIDTNGVMEYRRFVQCLMNTQVTHAIYLDMGGGWNYSYYRDNMNSTQFIHSQRIPYTTNWIVFSK